MCRHTTCRPWVMYARDPSREPPPSLGAARKLLTSAI
eukprot:COSAG02_NODE_31342_length_535_cov_0.903670_2_plen_36_part_01